ncbi:MAG TPA: hypothetical protein PKC18_16875, partial [Lacipirellulaceae bacterium]|nr:hypothetical protein [Lacipirellulaceae bacterium]
AVVRRIAGEMAPVLAMTAAVREALDYAARVAAVIAEAERKWRAAPAAGREAARRAAQAAASRQIRQHLEQVAFDRLAQWRDPAQYAASFLEGKLRQWAQEPLAVDDGGDLKLMIVGPVENVPIFSPEARLGVRIEYMQGLTVDATGLYFRYRAGGVPEPVLDNLKVTADLSATALNQVKALGEEFLESFDLPITVKLEGNPDFLRAGMGGLRGGIPFSVKMDLFGTVSLTGSNFVLYPGNKVDWQGGGLELAVPTPAPVPLGPSGFGLYGVSGRFGPRENRLGFGTKFSTMATPAEVICLDAMIETSFPIKQFGFVGKLSMAGTSLMETEGIIDFTRGTVTGEFKPGNSPLSQLAFVSGKFELRTDRFIATGAAEVFGQRVGNLECDINMRDGSALIVARSGFSVFGVDVSGSVEGRVDPGFRHARIVCQGNVSVPGIKPYGTLPVSFVVAMDTDGRIDVEVQTFVQGLDLKFSVPSLRDLDIDELARRLSAAAAKAYHQLLKDMAEADAEMRQAAAKLDKRTRDYVDDRFGITWSTGNPELDRLGGQLSDLSKQTGGVVSDIFKQGGGAISDGGKKVLSVLAANDPTKWRFP